MVGVWTSFNQPIALHTPQGYRHGWLLDSNDPGQFTLGRIRELHEPGNDRIHAGQQTVLRSPLREAPENISSKGIDRETENLLLVKRDCGVARLVGRFLIHSR
jgi:hypothetical protein